MSLLGYSGQRSAPALDDSVAAHPDHMEGVVSDDVTGKHYDIDPQMQKKRFMMAQWTA